MKEIQIEKCPFCGGEEMIETGIYSYGKSYLSQNGRPFCTASLYATVCRDCGSVVRTYCKNPEKLFPKKERRE